MNTGIHRAAPRPPPLPAWVFCTLQASPYAGWRRLPGSVVPSDCAGIVCKVEILTLTHPPTRLSLNTAAGLLLGKESFECHTEP